MNVAAHSSPPVVQKPVVATPTPDVVKELITFIEPHDPEFALYVRLSGVLGARPGELCALQWRDIDFDAGELVVRRRVMRGQGRMVLEDLTKTGKIRRVPVDASTIVRLRSHQAASSQPAGGAGIRLDRDAFVFAAEPGGAMFWRPDRASRSFRTWLKTIRPAARAVDSLRHQAATTMIDRGVDPKTVSERLGNSVAAVLTTYTRAGSTADIAAADLMGGIYDS